MLRLLIDGHNLIGRMPGLSLADFDDEARLVEMLSRYAARRRARIVVVFDSGSPGGRSRALSRGGVEAIFAADGHTNADRVLAERMRELKRPQDWGLVSSDRALQAQAAQRRVRIIEAEDFASQLSPERAQTPAASSASDDKPDASGDIDEWLALFKRK